eukprot:4893542-Karenia_brevis.AAC.1
MQALGDRQSAAQARDGAKAKSKQGLRNGQDQLHSRDFLSTPRARTSKLVSTSSWVQPKMMLRTLSHTMRSRTPQGWHVSRQRSRCGLFLSQTRDRSGRNSRTK